MQMSADDNFRFISDKEEMLCTAHATVLSLVAAAAATAAAAGPLKKLPFFSQRMPLNWSLHLIFQRCQLVFDYAKLLFGVSIVTIISNNAIWIQY